MDKIVPLTDLSKPEQLSTLRAALSEMSDELDILYSTTAPNGAISGRQGRLCLYYTGSAYQLWLNVDGATTWVEVTNQSDFVTGDWIHSSVTTARSGWTDVSATYTGKFVRVSATPLSTGGANTHTHAAGSYAGPSHTHAAGTLTAPAHTHDQNMGASVGNDDNTGLSVRAATASDSTLTLVGTLGGTPKYLVETGVTSGGGNTCTGSTAADGTGAITGTSASGDNVPTYVSACLFQKD